MVNAYKVLATSSQGEEVLVPEGVTRIYYPSLGVCHWTMPLNSATVHFAINILKVAPTSQIVFKDEKTTIIRRVNGRFEVSYDGDGLNNIKPFDNAEVAIQFVGEINGFDVDQ